MTLIVALVAALVSGGFALAGGYLQGRRATEQLRERFEHERKLAAEEHARAVVADENRRLRRTLESQLEYGRRVGVAGARFQSSVYRRAKPGIDPLADAMSFAGLDMSAAVPYANWVHPVEIEDSILRGLVDAHRTLVQDLDSYLVFADRPDEVEAPRLYRCS